MQNRSKGRGILMNNITYSSIEESKFLDFNFNNLNIHNLKIDNNTDPIIYNGQVFLFSMFLPYGHSLMDVYAQYKILKLKYPQLRPVLFEDSSRGLWARNNNISKDLVEILDYKEEIIDISTNTYVFDEAIMFFDVSDTLPIQRYVPFCNCHLGTEPCGTSEWFKYNYLAIDIIRKDIGLHMESNKFRKIFISREKYNQQYFKIMQESRSQQRYYRDEKKLEDFFRSEGYEIIYAEEYGLIEQVKLFSQANTIASVSGAGLFNLLWGNEETKGIEIMVNPLYRYHFKEFGNYVKINYVQIDSRKDSFEEMIEKLKVQI
jgi:hypothetical protein